MSLLPTKKTEVKRDLWQYNWLLYGQPKIGKTTFAAEFNEPLFICTEDRHKHLSLYKLPATGGAIKTWQEFREITLEISKQVEAGTFKWKTVVIDTVDNLYKLCCAEFNKEHDIVHESDLEWGKGYKLLEAKFFSAINFITSLGVGVVFISHSEEKTIKTKTVEYSKTLPGLPKIAREMVSKIADIIGYIGFDKEENRIINLQGNRYLEAGCATDVQMPESMPLDYKLLQKEFNKGAK